MNTFYHGDCKIVMNHDITPESVDLLTPDDLLKDKEE